MTKSYILPRMLVRLLFCGSFALCAAVAAAAPLRAQPAVEAEEPPAYRQLVADALAEYEGGHFEESRALMARAHALFPNARTLRGLGMVSFELREYVDSVRYLEQALASHERPLDTELQSQTAALLERARRFVGQLALQVRPAHAHVLVDGSEVLGGDRRSIVLEVGEHELWVRAEGHSAERRHVRITGGEEITLSVVLVQVAPPVERAEATHAERPVWYKRPWLWVATGAVVAAGAGLGVGLALRADPAPREPPYRGLSGEQPFVGPTQ